MNISSKLSFKDILNGCNDVVDFIGDDQKIVLVATQWQICYNNNEASRRVVYELNRTAYNSETEYVISNQYLSFPCEKYGYSSVDYTTWFGGGYYYKSYDKAFKEFKDSGDNFYWTDKERMSA